MSTVYINGPTSVSALGNIKSFSQVCGHPLAPSGMVTLDLLPMRTHTCNAGGLREGVESQDGQIRARRVKAATWCICWLLQRGSCRHGWKEVRREPPAAPYQLRMQEGHGWHEGWQKSWDVRRSQGLGGGGGSGHGRALLSPQLEVRLKCKCQLKNFFKRTAQ